MSRYVRQMMQIGQIPAFALVSGLPSYCAQIGQALLVRAAQALAAARERRPDAAAIAPQLQLPTKVIPIVIPSEAAQRAQAIAASALAAARARRPGATIAMPPRVDERQGATLGRRRARFDTSLAQARARNPGNPTVSRPSTGCPPGFQAAWVHGPALPESPDPMLQRGLWWGCERIR